jgi:hypothetical protein
VIENYPIQISDINTIVNLSVLPLGYYDLLIGMDWLEAHTTIVYFFNKSFICKDDDGNTRIVKGILKEVKVMQISTMQLKNNACKGF